MSRRHRIRKRMAGLPHMDMSPEAAAKFRRNLNESAIAMFRYIANAERETPERREGARVALAAMGLTA